MTVLQPAIDALVTKGFNPGSAQAIVEDVIAAIGWPVSDTEYGTLISVVGVDGDSVKVTARMACELITRVPNLRVLGLTVDEIRIARDFWKVNHG